MKKSDNIFIAGHKGLVGNAVYKLLKKKGFKNLITIDRKKIDILQRVDNHFITYLKEKKIYKNIWQAFAILLPVKSVGVMGDERTYNYSIALRAVTSVDGMTADFYMFSKKDLTEISKKIISNVKEVNRVLYDFTSKPPGTIEWE